MMKTTGWSVADDSAAEEGLYVHFRTIGTYLLPSEISYGNKLTLHFMNRGTRGPPH